MHRVLVVTDTMNNMLQVKNFNYDVENNRRNERRCICTSNIRFRQATMWQNSPAMPTDASLKSVCQTFIMDAEALGNEITLFNKMFNDERPKDDHLSSFEKRLKYFEEKALENAFLNLQKLYRLYLTILVTSVSAERSFSTQRQLTTYLRTTIRTQESPNREGPGNQHRQTQCEICIDEKQETPVYSIKGRPNR